MAGTRIESLLSEQVNAVSFVMDYVEFHFNGPILRALSNPVVEYQGHRVRFPDAGSRDALCSLIGSDVASVNVRPDDRVDSTRSKATSSQSRWTTRTTGDRKPHTSFRRTRAGDCGLPR